MKRIIIFITLITVLPILVTAQSIKRAERLMAKYDYTNAIVILKKAANEDKMREQAIPLLAECYKQQNDIYNAKVWYAQTVALANVDPKSYLEYGKALQATGDYTLAKEMFLKYSKLNPSDPLGKQKAAHCDSVVKWVDMPVSYKINTVSGINTTASEFGPAIYDGGLVYVSDRIISQKAGDKYGWTGRGYLKILQANPHAAGEFSGEMDSPEVFKGKFNQQFHDGPACFSSDGNQMYFTRTYRDRAKKVDNYKTNMLKIFYSVKTNDKWGKLQEFHLNSPDYSVGHPSLSADGQTLYFVSDMPGGHGGTDIWMCKRQGDAWGEAINLGNVINTTENEMFPTIDSDGTLYFSSDGHPGYGALDIFKSFEKGGKWSTPQNLYSPLNSSFDDFAVAMIPHKKMGFFSSNRVGGFGNDDIYGFTEIEKVTPPVEPQKVVSFITGVVKDKKTAAPVENATVFVLNPNTGKVIVLKTSADGVYKTQIDNRPTEYIVKAMKPTYLADCTPFNVTTIKEGSTIQAPRELLLDKLEINRVFKVENIYYDFDKYNIREDAKPELDNLVKIMQDNPINVELGSHTDCRGSLAYNDKLSQNRAQSAVDYIISRGISQTRIIAHGYGERQLINKCSDNVTCTDEEHQMNRRTEFKIIEYSTPQQQVGQFNPDAFHKGEEVDERFLPGDFFNSCK